MNEKAVTDEIPLVEEVAHLTKERVSTGRVTVRTVTDAFDEKVEAELMRGAVSVTRVPIDREVTTIPQIRTEGNVTIVPVLEETLFVEKRLVLKEEIHIRRAARTEQFETPVTLRRQRAVVERREAAGIPQPEDPPNKNEDMP